MNPVARRRLLFVPAVFLLLLGAAVVALPRAVESWARRALARHPVYDGDFRAMDLRLIAGRARVHDVVLRKRGEAGAEPFLKAETVEASIEWRPLLRRRLFGGLLFINPQVFITAGSPPAVSPSDGGAERSIAVQEVFSALVPFQVDRVEVRGGVITYQDLKAGPPITLRADSVTFTVDNLSKRRQFSGRFPARAELRARLMASGGAAARLDFDPAAAPPFFNLDFAVRDLPLPAMNGVMRRYAGVEAAAGRLSLRAATSSREGRFEGRIAPVLEAFEVRAAGAGRPPRPVERPWTDAELETVLDESGAADAGGRVPVSGSLRSPSADVWTAAVDVARRAFFAALSPVIGDRADSP